MLIGIDASKVAEKERTGTENYSKELIEALLNLAEAKKHEFRLYTKENIKWPRLWTQGGLAWECLRRPPDVLFVPAHTLPIIRWPKVKTVVTIHGLEYEYLPEYYQFPAKLYLTKSTEYAARYADRLIAVSNWTKSELVSRLKAKPEKITVIYEGIGKRILAAKDKQFSREYLRQIRYKYGITQDYILFIGTIQPRKNLVRLIEAFSKLDNQCELVIGGKQGWLDEEIYQAPKRFGVEKRVKFIGRVAEADLAAIYHSARLFCWPSLMEGFGLPVLEAMSLKVAVVTSNRGALPEVVGEAGLLVNPEKVNEISQAMKLVLENQDLRQVLVEKGLAQIKKFSWKKAAQETLAVLTKGW
ncbi:MAG: glycosyltransferase family 1 protein [Candidatus Beckwithbacteria bacterium]